LLLSFLRDDDKGELVLGLDILAPLLLLGEEKGLGDEEVPVWQWNGKTRMILQSTLKGLRRLLDS
jgi:hypothetical protein